jgi:hypothetical protein
MSSLSNRTQSFSSFSEAKSTESGKWFLTSLKVQYYHAYSIFDTSTSTVLAPKPILTSSSIPIHLNTLRSYDWTLKKLYLIYNNTTRGIKTKSELSEAYTSNSEGSGGEDIHARVRLKGYWLQTHVMDSDGFGNDKRVNVLLGREGWWDMLEKMRVAAEAGKGKLILSIVCDGYENTAAYGESKP